MLHLLLGYVLVGIAQAVDVETDILDAGEVMGESIDMRNTKIKLATRILLKNVDKV